MFKKSALLAVLALVLMAPMASHALTVNYDSGTQYNTTSLTGFSTYGDMMDGMSVTAYFAAGGSQTLAWADTVANAGGVTGTSWSLSQSGDTYTNSWSLSSDVTLSQLVIDAAPGDTIFDITWSGSGTPGSASGRTFTTAYTGDLTATYRNLLSVGGNDPVGDLYTLLDLDFGASGFLGNLSFIADTDNAASAGDVVPAVPEPSTFLLFGGGLLGLGYLGRKRMKS
ncbi:hypothetical protein A7E78_13680 [Syntrophotalea acetylenivorans]|uniref:Ice-binding protein C-terminal domain-containing protein n=1 Tax=Syntrophotalea acetylenivorans TaxID=1842532 RepID=A0A1L3GSA7_9BACT|nr:PEP-CTERM sorting domain-containing protein [Syntrophotalea acetylenivorans]APG28785.1 hypothetical protein A7E78_13680 [Syntrophotalea acetylenivorans]